MTFLEKIKLFPYYLKGYLLNDPARNGEYKFLNSKFLNIKNNDNFVLFDIGANIGEYSEYVNDINSNCEIHCFEPVKKTFDVLKQNLKNKNTVFNNFALSNEVGEIEMYVYEELAGMNSIDFHPNVAEMKNVVVEKIGLNTLDNYIKQNKIESINLLKIDTEGHELNVIKGGIKTFDNKIVKAIQFEYNYLWRNTDNTLENVFKILEKNYNIYRLSPIGKIRIKNFRKILENYPKASNYIAILK